MAHMLDSSRVLAPVDTACATDLEIYSVVVMGSIQPRTKDSTEEARSRAEYQQGIRHICQLFFSHILK